MMSRTFLPTSLQNKTVVLELPSGLWQASFRSVATHGLLEQEVLEARHEVFDDGEQEPEREESALDESESAKYESAKWA